MKHFGMRLLFILCFFAIGANIATAREGNTRTTVFVGASSFSDGKTTSTGQTIGMGWGVHLSDNLLFSLSGVSTETQSEYSANGETYPLSASTISARTGVTHFLRATSDASLVPFVGGGFTVASYVIDYTYPDSEFGKTSGTAPGVYGGVGVEMRLGRSFTFIPQYQTDVVNIKTEAGDSVFLRSSGLMLSIRISS